MSNLEKSKRDLENARSGVTSSKQEVTNFFSEGLKLTLVNQKQDEPVYLTKFKFKDSSDLVGEHLIKKVVIGLKSKLESHPHYADENLSALVKLKDDVLLLIPSNSRNLVEVRFHSEIEGKAIVTLPSIGVRVYITLKLNDFCSIYVSEYETSN